MAACVSQKKTTDDEGSFSETFSSQCFSFQRCQKFMPASPACGDGRIVPNQNIKEEVSHG